tara:strand:- start:168 stop:287 length:120 start_codon:yes stop_codon:yes gene_type:complete
VESYVGVLDVEYVLQEKKTNLSKIRGNRNYKDRIKNYDP